jgi:hypothetical protein
VVLVNQAGLWSLMAIVIGVPVATGLAILVIWRTQGHRAPAEAVAPAGRLTPVASSAPDSTREARQNVLG